MKKFDLKSVVDKVKATAAIFLTCGFKCTG